MNISICLQQNLAEEWLTKVIVIHQWLILLIDQILSFDPDLYMCESGRRVAHRGDCYSPGRDQWLILLFDPFLDLILDQ